MADNLKPEDVRREFNKFRKDGGCIHVDPATGKVCGLKPGDEVPHPKQPRLLRVLTYADFHFDHVFGPKEGELSSMVTSTNDDFLTEHAKAAVKCYFDHMNRTEDDGLGKAPDLPPLANSYDEMEDWQRRVIVDGHNFFKTRKSELPKKSSKKPPVAGKDSLVECPSPGTLPPEEGMSTASSILPEPSSESTDEQTSTSPGSPES